MNTLEQEFAHWNRMVHDRPTDPKGYIRRGMVQFKQAQIAASIQDFDRAEQLDPTITPYLWQRGLSLYYADRFEEGAAQFEVDLTVNAQDTEETVWRFLCMARLHGAEEARRELRPVRHDPRPIMRPVYDLYAGACTPADVLAMGVKIGNTRSESLHDRSRFYSHLYVGLYYEATNRPDLAQEQIRIAVDRAPLDDYMGHLAGVHAQLRGWT